MPLESAWLTVTNAFAALRLLPLSDRDKDVEIWRCGTNSPCWGGSSKGPAPGSRPRTALSSLPCSIAFPNSASVGFDCW
ncbi:hypothetical protein [Streptomyces milbemycinicus]|uniref:hypothetical protein n=1 Tax=Streptomyces milbemycinicus TaxID=476552 RepID=UPI0033D51057